MEISNKAVGAFQALVYDYYSQHGRDLSWRRPDDSGQFDPYKIMVSELMLQQTQALRVEPKYHQFLETFPALASLAQASLGTVLTAWSGLGYNRRAKYLHEAAKALKIVDNPWTLEALVACKGIGANTAKAILVYSFNQLQVFVETNVRTVVISSFFPDESEVVDGEIEQVLAQLIDENNPREFYWALMDYGTFLKQQRNVAHQKSKHYRKQTKFEGSARQVRGKIIKALATRPYTTQELLDATDDQRTLRVLEALEREGLVIRQDESYKLP